MKLDALIRRLLPRDNTFFLHLERSTENLVNASLVMKQLSLSNNKKERALLIDQMHALEHEGDSIAHRIFQDLNATFVTPLDREDIHLLASSLDDILDHIDGCAGRLTLYRVDHFPNRMKKLVDILEKSIAEVKNGVSLLRNIQETERLQQVVQKINQYENDADTVFEEGVAELFDREKNPITIIKLKEIYVGLETATDKCEDVANVLDAIIIKHA